MKNKDDEPLKKENKYLLIFFQYNILISFFRAQQRKGILDFTELVIGWNSGKEETFVIVVLLIVLQKTIKFYKLDTLQLFLFKYFCSKFDSCFFFVIFYFYYLTGSSLDSSTQSLYILRKKKTKL
jgi:hypothetical protein